MRKLAGRRGSQNTNTPTVSDPTYAQLVASINCSTTTLDMLRAWQTCALRQDLRSRDITANLLTYAGMISAMLLKKSHLTPRPPSHVYVFPNVKLFTSPGCTK